MNNLEKISFAKILFFLIIILTVFVIGKGIYNAKELKTNHLLSRGKILKFTSGGTAGGLHFEYPENSNKYNPVMSVGGQVCRRLITQKMDILNKYEFPVVYSKSNFENAQILIFRHQYETYGVDIPDELKTIVETLSACKD